MIFSALEYTDTIPFDTVLIHGLVRDAQGRKMSKSLGNGIDPLDIISQYGADALRFALLTGNSPGNDMRFSPEKIEAARNFTNKIWNASRFALMNIPESLDDTALPEEKDLRIEDNHPYRPSGSMRPRDEESNRLCIFFLTSYLREDRY